MPGGVLRASVGQVVRRRTTRQADPTPRMATAVHGLEAYGCPPCEVEWADDPACFNCGQPGQPGGLHTPV